jgi:hypothetical protein
MRCSDHCPPPGGGIVALVAAAVVLGGAAAIAPAVDRAATAFDAWLPLLIIVGSALTIGGFTAVVAGVIRAAIAARRAAPWETRPEIAPAPARLPAPSRVTSLGAPSRPALPDLRVRQGIATELLSGLLPDRTEGS